MNLIRKNMALAIVLVLVLAVAAFGAYNVVSAQLVGAGGLIVKGGDVRFQTATGVDKAFFSGTTGAATLPYCDVVNDTSGALTITSAHFGKTVVATKAAATTITLPAPSAALVGATLFVAQSVDQNLTITLATADNNAIIADGVLTTDNVAFSTGSHKIGAMARVTCISSTKWLITNASSCAMTVEAAD